MNDLTDIYSTKWPAGGATFAEPQSPTPYADIFRTGSKPLIAGNMMDQGAARADVIDDRIKAMQQAASVTLENPENGGYAKEAAAIVRARIRSGEVSYLDRGPETARVSREMYAQKEGEIRQKHPELEFGDLDAEAQARVKKATEDYEKATADPSLNPILKYGTEFAATLYGQRRDPLFLGSLFAGPASATAKTALAKLTVSALSQGLYNAGLSAAEQPAVQSWRAKMGEENGIVPALHDVGLALAVGAGLGALGHVVVESFKEGPVTALKQILEGRSVPGDFDKAAEGLGPVAPRDAAATHAGEQSIEADHALMAELTRPSEAPGWIAYHGTASGEFEKFDLDRPTSRSGFPRGAEQGVGFFSPTPDLAKTFASGKAGRIIEANITPGRTADFDALNLWLNDEKFHDEIRALSSHRAKGATAESDRASLEKIYDDRLEMYRKEYAEHQRVREELIKEGIPENQLPEWKLPLGTGAIAAIIERAKKQGLDTARISGLREGGQQILVFNPENIHIIDQGLHDDMLGAALKRADDPEAASPQAVAATLDLAKPNAPELQARIDEAAPRTEREAQEAADWALDDFGRRDGMAAIRSRMAKARSDQEDLTETWSKDRMKRARSDVMSKVPFVDANGNARMMSERNIKAMGDVEQTKADLVRSCK